MFQPRKKIIGADPVLIVWCEHPLDYHPDTIVSGVTQVHIIVYPYKKQGMPTGNHTLYKHMFSDTYG